MQSTFCRITDLRLASLLLLQHPSLSSTWLSCLETAGRPPLLPVPDATISEYYSCAAEVQLVPVERVCRGHLLLLCGHDLCCCGHPGPLQQDHDTVLHPTSVQLPVQCAPAVPFCALPKAQATKVQCGGGQDGGEHSPVPAVLPGPPGAAHSAALPLPWPRQLRRGTGPSQGRGGVQ
uniref:Putative secreted protein n=1 Tax=Ixodes scapularis TaxID=6945 RepID=A0A4D5RYJ9_IXOSC